MNVLLRGLSVFVVNQFCLKAASYGPISRRILSRPDPGSGLGLGTRRAGPPEMDAWSACGPAPRPPCPEIPRIRKKAHGHGHAPVGLRSILGALAERVRSAARQREPFPDRLIRLSHGRCPRGRPGQTTAKRRSISRLNATSHGSSVATRRRRRDARCIAYAGSRPNATPQRPARSTRNGPTMYGLLATPLSMLRRCLRPSLSAGDHSIRCHPSPHAKCFRACCSSEQFGSSGREQLVLKAKDFGGQTPLKIAKALDENGIKILGTSSEGIDLAEDRERFGGECIGLDRSNNSRQFTQHERLQ